jgi:hypothetical protein
MGNLVVTGEPVINEREPSVRPRRTTRVVVRLSVRIGVVGLAGEDELIAGRSLAVNKYGCKIESKKPLPTNQAVDITVFATGKKGRGKVVWADSHPNKDGNYEFAVQFDEPCNLWGVEFPPEDWEVEKENKNPAAASTPEQEISSKTSDQAAPPIQTDQTGAGTAPASVHSAAVKSDFPVDSPQKVVVGPTLQKPVFKLAPTPQEPVFKDESETVDLTPMIPAGARGMSGEVSQAGAPSSSPHRASNSEIAAASDPSRITTEGTSIPLPSAALTQSSETETASSPSVDSNVSPAPAADPASQLPGPKVSRSIPATPANRLAEAIRDLIQSTVSAQQSIAAEQLVKTMESRMAQMQLDVLNRLTKQVEFVVSTQTSVLKQRADEISSQSQQALAVHFQQMAEAADQNAKAVQGKAVSAIERAMDSLHNRVSEQLAPIEKRFLDQCRSLAEQSLSGIVENSLRTMSQRIEEVNKGFASIEGRTQKILQDTSVLMEQHAATKMDEIIKHMEAQLKEMAQRVYSNLQQYSVAELGKRHQAIEAAFQKQMQAVSESSLQEVQGALARMLQGLAEKMRPAPGEEVSNSNTP